MQFKNGNLNGDYYVDVINGHFLSSILYLAQLNIKKVQTWEILYV